MLTRPISGKGQFATEFIIVAVFALIFLSFGSFFIFYESGEKQKEADFSQLKHFGNKIMEAASDVSYAESASRTTVKGTMPAGVEDGYVENERFLVFNFSWGGKIQHAVFDSEIPLALDMQNFGAGAKTFVVEYRNDYISICDKDTYYSCDKFCNVTLENGSTSPSDCCLPDCTSCLEDNYTRTCNSDSNSYDECCGHNGCSSIC